MKHIPPSHKFSETDWQMLGDLEVGSDVDIEHVVQAWLNKTLGSLELPSDLLNGILRSACEATGRALQLKNSDTGPKHVQLLAFSSFRGQTTRQTWGFFRLEKLDAAAEADSPNHSIELYLYLEGE